MGSRKSLKPGSIRVSVQFAFVVVPWNQSSFCLILGNAVLVHVVLFVLIQCFGYDVKPTESILELGKSIK